MDKLKVFVIGLDGATFDLIKPWVARGLLPTFGKLLKEGSAGMLASTIPPMTAPAWTSFITGKNPGKHGLFDWIYRHKDSYDVSPVTVKHCQEPHISQLLSEAGLRVGIQNIPMTFPPYPVNGFVISGMPAPSKDVQITYPKDLLAEIEREVGEYLLYPDPGEAYSDSGIDAFIDLLYRTTETRFRVTEYLWKKDTWDFFMVVFMGTDTVQHAMWKFMSPEHPLHDPAKKEKYGDVILKYFQYLDKKIGEVIENLDDDTVVLLMSDHGFGPFHKFIHVNNWLQKNDWLKIKRSPWAQIKKTMFSLGFAPMKVYDVMMRMGFGRFKREVVRGKGQGLLKTFFLSFDEVDWPRTAAYSLGNVGQINLNVRGREPQGMVEPGMEYEKVRDEIIKQLWELRDPETGEQVIQEVYKREEVYRGKQLDEAADILFIPTRMEYFGFGEYEFGSNQIIESMRRGISGTHRPNGMFLFWGKPIKSGLWHPGANILDLAPTIMHLLGLPAPTDMDGRILEELIHIDFHERLSAAAAKVDINKSTLNRTFEGTGLSEDDEEMIAQRLRDLGYVG